MVGDFDPQEAAPRTAEPPFAGNEAAGHGHDGDGHTESPSEALRQAVSQFGELREYASYFVAARLDAIKLSIRSVGLYAALGVFGVFAAGGLVVTAVVLLCTGLAGAVGAAFQARWLGDLIIGGGLLLVVALGLYLMRMLVMRGWQRASVRKYEARKHDQQARFGHDIHERAKTTK